MPLSPPPVVQITILNGASLSAGVQVGAGRIIGIQLPTFTSASLSFQGSADGVTYGELVDSANAAVAFPASTGGQFIQIPLGIAIPPWIKVRSGTSGTPVNQAADRVISLVLGEL